EFVMAAALSKAPHVQIAPLPALGNVPAPQETGETFKENAALKATYYSRHTNELVFADDSGLVIDALGGEPGVFSARYAGPSASDAANNALVLERLRHTMNRHAQFVCGLALAQAGTLLTTVQSTAEGEILTAPRGHNGFGYDPLFFYPPLGRTFAELTRAEKLAVSHRGKALRALLEWLSTENMRSTTA
ncbi:MAG: RdgB/HAM1 family non-canonical purine NTP pyrophosphatase, partial [Acidobacteriaceae bacterium]|nr:RdgB/HAM1 family non-canonical purine NTP pyrophosphatase [Acidobacteriaceae bacterium]